MFRFQLRYFLWAIVIFAIEVIIALFFHDRFVRPYLGDVLVVILLYCLLKAFVTVHVWRAAIGVLIFSFIVEGLQYLHLVEYLGWQNNKIARIVVGNSFSVGDLLCYLSGIIIVLLVEKVYYKKR